MHSLYKYVNLEGLRRILAGSLRFTQPSAFNDPFELLPEIVMPVGETERPINLQFDLLAPRRNPPVGEVTDVRLTVTSPATRHLGTSSFN